MKECRETLAVENTVMRITYLFCGYLFLFIGAVGAIVPVLPTTPFLIIAAGCFSRSNEKIERWLKTHPVIGPPICNWQEFGCIPFRAKLLATMMISLSLYGMYFWSPLSGQMQIAIGALVTIGLVYVWTRPSTAPQTAIAQTTTSETKVIENLGSDTAASQATSHATTEMRT